MTDGHKHRMITVSRNGLIRRVLTRPLLHTLGHNEQVETSPYPYGPCPKREGPCYSHHDCWYLSALSILHRWTGLTLYYENPPDDPDEGVLDECGSG